MATQGSEPSARKKQIDARKARLGLFKSDRETRVRVSPANDQTVPRL